MRLSKLYSNEDFHEIKFNDGLNVILGKVNHPKDKTKDSHNLGKTTLIELIDFMMLKELSTEHFLHENKKLFANYVFYLEIKLNSGRYLTIKRGVSDASKVSFKYHDQKWQNFLEETQWDGDKITFKKSITYLENALNFDVLDSYSFRHTINYFLRSQSDYGDVFRLSKYGRGKDVSWKPLMFALLGFEPRFVKEKYEIEDQYTEQVSLVNKIKEKFTISTEERDEIQGLIEIKKTKRDEFQSRIDKFDYFKKEQSIKVDLIEKVEARISQLNSRDYSISFELNKIEESLSNTLKFDLEQTKKIYEEAKIYFAGQLVNDYDNLVKFNIKLFDERSKDLKIRKTELLTEKEDITKELRSLNNERSDSLSVIKDLDSFKKYKSYQKDLIDIGLEIAELENQLNNISKIEAMAEGSQGYLAKRLGVVHEINKQIKEGNNLYASIRKTFGEIIDSILNVPGVISIGKNNEDNVEFRAHIQSPDRLKLTSQGKGNTYQKILCMAFDLALLVNYRQHSFFRFIYHDGAFEAHDGRKKEVYLHLLRKYIKDYDVQYVLTSIEHDLPRDKDEKIISFNEGEVVLELSDDGDEGRLFKKSF